MAATIKDIASKTGLGLATISKYLNGGNVREENRAAIESAIRALDYNANVFARGLKSKRSRTVGVIIPDLSNLFITSILTTVQNILQKDEYAMLVCDCRTDMELERKSVSFLVGKGVDGIINMPVTQDGSHLMAAIDRNLPIVLVDRMITAYTASVDAVLIDNREASGHAVRHFLENGHLRIGIVVGPQEVYTSRERLQGYREALDSAGLPYDPALVRFSPYTLQGGYDLMKQLYASRTGMTAVLVTNYEMALGAVMALNELNVRIPADLSLIGFDDMLLYSAVSPRLTIVEQPLEVIGSQVAQLILERLSGKENGPAKAVTLPAKLQVGASVRPARHIRT
ncbi:MAG: LacI family transcriptional regulator [Clostridia bacterium]|nr:LacI family transcriptional regulator [Clostridia bacterium]